MQQLGWKGLIGDPGLLIALLGEMLAFSCFPFFFERGLFSSEAAAGVDGGKRLVREIFGVGMIWSSGLEKLP